MTKIKKILQERGMSQREFYDRMCKLCETPLPPYVISKIVNGKSFNYTTSTLIKICATLEVTPNEIITKEDFNHLFKKSE